VGITHWDDVEKIRRDRGEMSATLTALGTAAGSWRAGVTRIELAPGPDDEAAFAFVSYRRRRIGHATESRA